MTEGLIATTLWVILTAIGFAVSLWAVWDARRDLRIARRMSMRPAARYTIRAGLVQEVFGVLKMLQAAVLAASVIVPIPWLRDHFGLGLVFLLLLVVSAMVHRRYTSRKVIELVKG